MTVDYGSPITSLDSGTFNSTTLNTIQDLINSGNPDVTSKWIYSGMDRMINPDWDPIEITYSIGTTDLIHEIQTVNVLLCVLIFFMVIVTFFVAFYVVQNRFKLDRR